VFFAVEEGTADVEAFSSDVMDVDVVESDVVLGEVVAGDGIIPIPLDFAIVIKVVVVCGAVRAGFFGLG